MRSTLIFSATCLAWWFCRFRHGLYLCFHLVGKCGTEVLQPFAVFPTVEQHLIHHDKELPCPVGIELAAEILVDVVQCQIDVPCLLALAFGSVALDVPKRFRDTLLATELHHSPVDCHSPHNGDNTVFHLAAVHVVLIAISVTFQSLSSVIPKILIKEKQVISANNPLVPHEATLTPAEYDNRLFWMKHPNVLLFRCTSCAGNDSTRKLPGNCQEDVATPLLFYGSVLPRHRNRDLHIPNADCRTAY